MDATKCPLIKGKTQEEEIQICLNCPFPQCLLEIPESHLKYTRDPQIRELARQGETTAELASIFNVSERTIQRCNTIYGEKIL